MQKRDSSSFMQWMKTRYKITIGIEAVETGGEETPAGILIRLAGYGRKKVKKQIHNETRGTFTQSVLYGVLRWLFLGGYGLGGRSSYWNTLGQDIGSARRVPLGCPHITE